MMVGFKLLTLKHSRCFHILAAVLVEAGEPGVFAILWVGVGGTKRWWDLECSW